MQKTLLATILFCTTGITQAEDAILDLETGDTVLATCIGDTVECPPPVCSSKEFPIHGGSHKHAAKRGNVDCRSCHGNDLNGSNDSITTSPVSCIAIDGLVLPNGVDPIPVEFVDGVWFTNYEGTSIGVLPAGIQVGCGLCHKEAEFKYNGREYEFSFEDWRKANGGDD